VCVLYHQLSIRLSVQALSVARGPPFHAFFVTRAQTTSLPLPGRSAGWLRIVLAPLLIQVERRAHGLLAELLSHGRPEQEAHAAFRSASCHAQRGTFVLVGRGMPHNILFITATKC
jgi:hypothetical protein